MTTQTALHRPEADRAPAPFADNHAYLADALDRLDARLRLGLSALRRESGDGSARAALYISHEEADGLLASAPPADADAETRRRLDAWQRASAERADVSLRQGVSLGLPHLARRFGLSAFEAEALLVCLAPELRRRYDALYAYLQDDITRKRPSADLVLDLLCDSEAERWDALARFDPQAPLLHAGLLQPVADPASPSGSSALARFLQLDPRVLQFVLGHATLDDRLDGLVRLHAPGAPGHVPGPEAGLPDFVRRHVGEGGGRLVVDVHGPPGAGKRALALALGAALGRPLLELDVRRLPGDPAEATRLLRLAFREGLLHGAPLYLAHAGALLGDDAVGLRAGLAETVGTYGGLVVVGGSAPWPHPGLFAPVPFHAVALSVPGAAARAAVWRDALAPLAPDDALADRLGGRFRLTPGRIHAAAAALAHRRAVRDDDRPVGFEALAAVCREQSHHGLGALATKISPRYGWDHLVLPEAQRRQLAELCDQVRYDARVFDAWGFGRRLAHGRGLSALFAGPPGTGKTLAADVVAGELGLDLLKVDLARVVSKYIGETEKNLGRIFDEAAHSNAVLFFDEADALFGKRTEISDARDRYANLETSYLLQRMEAYDGVVVLASNLRENMDSAFLRRIRFVVEFPFPDGPGRRAIWQAHLPPEAPVADDLDLDRLAEGLHVAGGTIKNIALRAAFFAAADEGEIGMEQLRQAARREFEKIGKLWDERALASEVP